MNSPTGPGGPIDDERFITMTSHTVYETLMKETLRTIKEMPKTWKQMTEIQQDAVLAQLDYGTKQALRMACEIIAAEERPNILAKLDQVVLKDGIKATLKIGDVGDYIHALADAVDTTVILVIADPSAYIKGERPKAEPAQQDLNLGGAINDAMTDAERAQKEEDERLAKEHAEEIRKLRDEANCIIQLAEVGFDILPEEIANWSLEEITEARACAVALKNQKDGEEVVLPPILTGRFRKGRPTDIHDPEDI